MQEKNMKIFNIKYIRKKMLICVLDLAGRDTAGSCEYGNKHSSSI